MHQPLSENCFSACLSLAAEDKDLPMPQPLLSHNRFAANQSETDTDHPENPAGGPAVPPPDFLFLQSARPLSGIPAHPGVPPESKHRLVSSLLEIPSIFIPTNPILCCSNPLSLQPTDTTSPNAGPVFAPAADPVLC